MLKKYRSIDLYSNESCEFISYDFSSKATSKISDSLYSIKGAGTSIVASYFSKVTKVIETKSSNEVISFDLEEKEITVRPSMKLTSLYELLIPYQLFITSVPSYPFASIGGCIAANVHGQNHIREGCFENNIKSIVLFHPDKGFLECSATQNPKIFSLTIGGYGSTGVIHEVKLNLVEIKTNLLDVENIPFTSLIEGFKLMEKNSQNVDYLHSWCDMASASPKKQVGYISLGRFTSGNRIKKYLIDKELKQNHLPIKINVFGTKAINFVNKLYFIKNIIKRQKKTLLHNFIFPSMSNLFYFSMFGKKGIIEHQVLIPKKNAEKYLTDLMTIINDFKPIIALCHLKVFEGKEKYLRFDGTGYCLALHFYNNSRGFKTLEKIDLINHQYKCKVNLIKDSRLSANSIETQYSEIECFKSDILEYDSNLKFRNRIIEKIFNHHE